MVAVSWLSVVHPYITAALLEERQVRSGKGLSDRPSARTDLMGELFQLYSSAVIAAQGLASHSKANGLALGSQLKTEEGILEVQTCKPTGLRRQEARSVWGLTLRGGRYSSVVSGTGSSRWPVTPLGFLTGSGGVFQGD